MGFREDIPIEGFVQSNPFLTQTFNRTTASFVISSSVLDRQIFLDPDTAGPGAETLSTSMALEAWPSVVWDVNGYYRDLGVDFRATRKQLMLAYNALDGQSSERLTYVFSQLLDPEIRRKYDACPLGSLFLDEYVQGRLKKKAMEMAQEQGVTAESILDRWGFKISDPEEAPGQARLTEPEPELGEPDPQSTEAVDIPQKTGEDEIASPDSQSPPWPYTYYLWKVRLRDHHDGNEVVMRNWQEAIFAECQRRRVAVSFAVGLMGGTSGSRVLTMSVRGTTVVFVSIDYIDQIEHLAPIAVDRLTHIRD